MTTRLQAHIDGALREKAFIFDRIYCIHLCVRFPCFVMPALANNGVIIDNYTAHPRIGIGSSQPVLGQLNTAVYVFFMYLHHHKNSI
jgi:hypothetical protein